MFLRFKRTVLKLYETWLPFSCIVEGTIVVEGGMLSLSTSNSR